MEERKVGLGMPPVGFTSLPLDSSSSKLPSLSGANDQTDDARGGNTVQVPRQNLAYSHTLIRDSTGDSDSDSDSQSNPDVDPATRIGSVPYFKTLSQPQLVPPQVESAVTITYRECQKNHAAAMGAHVVDGCGEFMPNGEEGTPEALKCAACACHRNFHRRDQSGAANSHPPPFLGNGSTRRATDHNQRQQVLCPFPPPHMMTFGGGRNRAQAESSSEQLNSLDGTPGAGTPSSSSRKRFRTKFSEEQKEKMQEFGERLGWKIQKQDEQQVQEFCDQVGVKRQVFKVWMHNSKQASKKKLL